MTIGGLCLRQARVCAQLSAKLRLCRGLFCRQHVRLQRRLQALKGIIMAVPRTMYSDSPFGADSLGYTGI